ncbi:MAG: ISKra4 family transposase, partial [Planctomycetes bacterium]|nr:ISKra4 family transposase [Planctomycetota bacterium]
AIGSGVTEAACKVLIKQRMCISGSRWKDDGASCVLALRSLKLTKGRWQQFWGYVMRHGCTLY